MQLGDVAERWYELGEVDKAKDLFAEGPAQIAGQSPTRPIFRRGYFAAELARVDVPAALAIAKDFAGDTHSGTDPRRSLFRLIDQNPAEAERIWNQTKGKSRLVAHATLCWKMATVDPCGPGEPWKAWLRQSVTPTFTYLALGSKSPGRIVLASGSSNWPARH